MLYLLRSRCWYFTFISPLPQPSPEFIFHDTHQVMMCEVATKVLIWDHCIGSFCLVYV